MPPEDYTEAGNENNEEDEEENGCEKDIETRNLTQENCADIANSREMALDFLYLAARNILQSGVEANPERMNHEEDNISSHFWNISYNLDSAGGDRDGCYNGDDEEEEEEEEEEDQNVDMVLEEIRRIVETLLGSAVSELVDAERRISLKSLDELVSQNESVSNIMDEWDYDDTEELENDDCQGMVERLQLITRPPEREASQRPLSSQHEGNHHSDFSSESFPSNPDHGHNTFVVFFDPGKYGAFRKLATEEQVKTPKVKRTVLMKRTPQKPCVDKDKVKRWSADEEKQKIARLLRDGILEGRRDVRTLVQRRWQTSSGFAAPEKPQFAVCLAVGPATAEDVRVAFYTNRVLEAEIARGRTDGQQSDAVLLRHWAVPEGVDNDELRCFLGDGLLLVTVLPLPEGFAWPFVAPPVLLGRPVSIPCPCDITP